MTIPSSGAISLNDIHAEFGGDYALGSYYRGGANLPGNGAPGGYGTYAPNVPTSGTISIGNFYGAKKISFTVVAFTSSTTYTVPATLVGNLTVYVQGGGGGGGAGSDYWGGNGGNGGAGGIGSASVGATPGGSYSITVGGGGGAGAHYYGYPGNPFADGYGGGGGGASNAFGVYAGGGGGGGGGNPGATGGGGGNPYGGSGGASHQSNTYGYGYSYSNFGGNGGSSGNSLSWGGAGGSYGAGGAGDNAFNGYHLYPSAGGQGYIAIFGYW